MLEAIHSPSTPCAEIFPETQPYKALYAVHAIEEYLDSARRQGTKYYSAGERDNASGGQRAHAGLIVRIHSLLIRAISDLRALDASLEGAIQGRLCSSLIGLYLRSSNGVFLVYFIAFDHAFEADLIGSQKGRPYTALTEILWTPLQ